MMCSSRSAVSLSPLVRNFATVAGITSSLATCSTHFLDTCNGAADHGHVTAGKRILCVMDDAGCMCHSHISTMHEHARAEQLPGSFDAPGRQWSRNKCSGTSTHPT